MENISEEDGWEFVNLGDQQSFGIKTAGLEEKATACQMLVSGPSTTNRGGGGALNTLTGHFVRHTNTGNHMAAAQCI